jgi:spore coat protein A
MQRLTMMPGERYDVVIDFSGVAPGTNLILRNIAKTPFPAGTAPQGSTVGRIMQFRVTAAADGYSGGTFDPTVAGVTLRGGTGQGPAIVRLVDPATGTALVTPSPIRQLTLNEVMGLGGPLEILVNNTKWDGLSVDTDHFTDGIRSDFEKITVNEVDTYYSELPQEGTTELWEIVNLTADAHPIHLHLVQFQLMNRQNFNTNKYNGAYSALFPATTNVLDPMTGLPYPGGVFIGGYGPPLNYSTGNPRALGGNPDITPYLQGPIRLPDPNEAGWKDTVIMYPGQVTRIMVRWAPTSLSTTSPADDLFFPFDPSDGLGHGYVWHCHIIDHEDNEMMRPDAVILNSLVPANSPKRLQKGVDY